MSNLRAENEWIHRQNMLHLLIFDDDDYNFLFITTGFHCVNCNKTENAIGGFHSMPIRAALYGS